MPSAQVATPALTKQDQLREAGRKRLQKFRNNKKQAKSPQASAASSPPPDAVPIENQPSNPHDSNLTADDAVIKDGVSIPFAENGNDPIPNVEHLILRKSTPVEQPPASKGLHDCEFGAPRDGYNGIDEHDHLKATNRNGEGIFLSRPAGKLLDESGCCSSGGSMDAYGSALGPAASQPNNCFHQNNIWSSSVAAERPMHDFVGKYSVDFPNIGINSSLGFNHHVSDANNAITAKPEHPLPTFYRETPINHSYSDPMASESRSHRSHPSFLESILSERSTSYTSTLESEKPLGHVKSSMVDVASGKSSSPYPTTVHPFADLTSLHPQSSQDHHIGDTSQLPGHESMDKKLESSSRFDEDFKALEQHIEDLTQEKFSLQRAVEASKTLAESLAAENSSLTDSFNQQGEVVSQLKVDLEKLQEELGVQLSALDAMRMEYNHAQLECNAADERAEVLASEVIGLEEKALRLRSNELKLEKQLESATDEIHSYKKKVSNLEKEHRSTQTAIAALQEEKKMLQSKLQKASSDGKQVDAKRSNDTKDASTSTDDSGLEVNNAAIGEASAIGMVTDDDHVKTVKSPALMPDMLYTGLPSTSQTEFHLSSSFFTLPSDQLRIVDNIKSLIIELQLEKEGLLRDLLRESSEAFRLNELNKELSQKLESQTQRLELLTAQNMAHESSTLRRTDSYFTQSSPAYADEGDEVVERVLGWIMKLFPGGSVKRRTRKLL